jgi:hypothetical protein
MSTNMPTAVGTVCRKRSGEKIGKKNREEAQTRGVP